MTAILMLRQKPCSGKHAIPVRNPRLSFCHRSNARVAFAPFLLLRRQHRQAAYGPERSFFICIQQGKIMSAGETYSLCSLSHK